MKNDEFQISNGITYLLERHMWRRYRYNSVRSSSEIDSVCPIVHKTKVDVSVKVQEKSDNISLGWNRKLEWQTKEQKSLLTTWNEFSSRFMTVFSSFLSFSDISFSKIKVLIKWNCSPTSWYSLSISWTEKKTQHWFDQNT